MPLSIDVHLDTSTRVVRLTVCPLCELDRPAVDPLKGLAALKTADESLCITASFITKTKRKE